MNTPNDATSTPRKRHFYFGWLLGLAFTGLSVVLDFPANTVANRHWMRGIFDRAGVAHRLHFLDVPDAVCKKRLRLRNAEGSHDFAASEADFEVITGMVARTRGQNRRANRPATDFLSSSAIA